MASTPGFMAAVVAGAVTLSLADGGNRAAPNNVGVLYTAPVGVGAAGGALIERIRVTPNGTCTATRISFYLYDGAALHLLFDIGLDAQTVAAASPQTSQVYVGAGDDGLPGQFPINVPTGWSLRCSMNDAQAAGVQIIAEGGGAE